MVTHPTAGRRSGTLVNRLLGMGMSLSSGGDPDRPGIVHRLDAGTSGLLIVAKDDEAHRALTAMLAERRIARTYLALVRGRVSPDRFTVEAPLGRRAARVVVRRIAGVPAQTDVQVRQLLTDATLVEARPRTGRTHQIRVHLSSVGHPILGDRTYGGGGDDARRLGLSRPFLHAWRLSFDHPMTGRRVDIEEPLPDDLVSALRQAEVGRSAHRER
jgi:23S rRNA pseudouridine1911/1915/1917 synthase